MQPYAKLCGERTEPLKRRVLRLGRGRRQQASSGASSMSAVFSGVWI